MGVIDLMLETDPQNPVNLSPLHIELGPVKERVDDLLLNPNQLLARPVLVQCTVHAFLPSKLQAHARYFAKWGNLKLSGREIGNITFGSSTRHLPEAAFPVAEYVLTTILDHMLGSPKGPYWLPVDGVENLLPYKAIMLLLFCHMSPADEDRLLDVAKWNMIHTEKEVAVGIIHEFRRLWPKLSWDAQCIANYSQAEMAHFLLRTNDAFVVGRGQHDTKLWQEGDWRCVPAAVLYKNLSYCSPCSLIHYVPKSRSAWRPSFLHDMGVVYGIVQQ